MEKHRFFCIALLLLSVVALLGCREDPETAVTVVTGEFFDPDGTGYTVQCSGWFPDWIVQTSQVPVAGEPNFQLSQGYWKGKPIFEGGRIVGFQQPDPSTSASAPWLGIDFTTDPAGYMTSLKTYMLRGMEDVDFDANQHYFWFHAPLMIRREPHRGVTPERRLRSAEHSWITSSSLSSFGIGYYNLMGSYTLGQVYPNRNPALAQPAAADFLEGTFVFKLLFAEYDLTKIHPSLNPLVGAPEWTVLDAGTDTIAPHDVNVRLLQVDVAVRDNRAPTGWVFGTFVYDKSMTATPAWRRITPVGLQWGNDPTIGSPAAGPLAETWLAPSIPAVYGAPSSFGRHGRLNGPVDNPASSCQSCHSTAQVDLAHAVPGQRDQFRGVHNHGGASGRVAPSVCTTPQQMMWFRNVPGGTFWGQQSNCSVNPASGPQRHGLDYSLQLQIGLESALFYQNPNPCAALGALSFQRLIVLPEAILAGRRFGLSGEERRLALSAKVEAVTAFSESLKGLTSEKLGLRVQLDLQR